jgi:hypothetical protein
MLRRENKKREEKNRETLNAGRAWPEAPMQFWGPFSYCIAGECAQSEGISLSLMCFHRGSPKIYRGTMGESSCRTLLAVFQVAKDEPFRCILFYFNKEVM